MLQLHQMTLLRWLPLQVYRWTRLSRWKVDRSAAVSDATVSAKTISGVCLSNEVQESALGRNQRKEEGVYVDELWEDGLTYRK